MLQLKYVAKHITNDLQLLSSSLNKKIFSVLCFISGTLFFYIIIIKVQKNLHLSNVLFIVTLQNENKKV